MWARLPSSSGLSGWREVVAVKLSLASFLMHLCGPAQWLSFKRTPILLRGGPPADWCVSFSQLFNSITAVVVFLLIAFRLVLEVLFGGYSP